MECRLCGHSKTHKHGKMPKGHQRYFCPESKQTFCESFDTLYYWRRVSPEQVQQVLPARARRQQSARSQSHHWTGIQHSCEYRS